MSDFKQSLDYLYGLQKFGIKFGLNCTENLLARVGNPHKKLRCIHIAGTNGKGSTAAILSRILVKHGLKVGLYTSPHLVRFTERFRINEEEVSPERILGVFEKIRATLDESQPPTFFEMVTAMAFLYFAEEEADFVIVETGMGGRLDATNVITPEACVITNIGFDHQEYLGATLSSIAREKAGIIKQGVPVITGALQPVAQGIMKTTCMNKSAPLFRFKSDFRVRRNSRGTFQYKGLGMNLPSLTLNLRGHHQMGNSALALAALEVLERKHLLLLRPDLIREALQEVRWPARLEVLQTNPTIILDGAHNPQGAESLRDALKEAFSYQKLHLVIGIMADKDIPGILRRLLPLAETAIFTKPQYARAANPDELRKMARPYIQKCYVIADPASAIQEAKTLAGPDDLICITGSLYFAGEVKQLFGEPAL
ncbi:MAG: bifunctional folylpolyglutamate synthase/dihydrofolate synthase [Syntrophobacteraceae bacterium]|nr:bifunctional folylpolyglutamate synthase/dihydrofolate synthase [Syntrophobacteraceae bacterium]